MNSFRSMVSEPRLLLGIALWLLDICTLIGLCLGWLRAAAGRDGWNATEEFSKASALAIHSLIITLIGQAAAAAMSRKRPRKISDSVHPLPTIMDESPLKVGGMVALQNQMCLHA